MKNKILTGVLTLVIGLNFVMASAAEDYKQYMKNVPGIEAYPEASAINVYTDVKLTINPDKSYSYEVFYVKKILNYKGKTEYSDVKLPYDANFETIDIGECFTVNANGEKKPVPKEALHNTENYMAVLSPEYIKLKDWVINFPDVEPGAFIFLKYKKTNKRGDFVDGVEHLSEYNPYMKKKFTVVSPVSTPLYYEFKRDYPNLKFSETKDGGKNKYSWQIEKTNCIVQENSSPSFLITGCPIVYSTAKDWQEMMTSDFKKLSSGISTGGQVKTLADGITSGKTTDRDKLFAIYNYIANNFIFKPINTSDMDFTPQPVDKVISQKFGSPRELACLFVSLARAAGISNCYPAVVLDENNRYTGFQEKMAVRESINNLLVYYEGMLISPGSNEMPFGFAGLENCNVIIGKDTPVMEKYLFTKDVLRNKKVDIEFSNDNRADINYKAVYAGTNDYGLRQQFRNETEQKRKIWFLDDFGEKSMTIKDGPSFENIENLDKPLTIGFSADFENFFVNQGEYIYFKLPHVSLPIRISDKERKNPLQIFENFIVREEYAINNIPEGYKVIKPANDIHDEIQFGADKVEYNVRFKEAEKKLYLTTEIKIPQMLVSVEDFGKLKEFITKIHSPMNTMVFLRK